MKKSRMDIGWLSRAVAVCLFAAVGGCGLVLDAVPTSAQVQFYSVPFVCETNEAGEIVVATSLILYNLESGQADVYRRATLVVLETDPPPPEVAWDEEVIEPGVAVRLDCDSFARILTDDPNATFASEFEPGESVDGFLTVGVASDSDIPRLDALIQQQVFNETGGSSTSAAQVLPTSVSVTGWPPETD